ncbi:MAG TPA: DUF1080 domain-containing protein [Prolixibacteraceae bacterium]|nr:DUF1080 domain-containing protein [Prolixibacteraceae bacterium]
MKRIDLLRAGWILLLPLMLAIGCQAPKSAEHDWIQLFNGKDLEGWTPKIRGFEAGDNFANTFRVEDGLLKVRYDGYDTFGDRFAHLFYKDTFSHYLLRIEYRFVGEQCPGGPAWALRNSGVMIHGQPLATMEKDQDFPVSIEVQFLGGDGTGQRPTCNLCTPGTNVVMNGQLILDHCSSSSSKTYHGEEWVTAEVEVHGSGIIRHIVNGDTVIVYEQPQLDDRDPSFTKLLPATGDKLLRSGTLSLQGESHPIDFRKVELKVLED